nr:hypothetical protein [Tanacetum cinerariifolium]
MKFKNQEFSSESRKEFCKKFSELSKKEIERPKALDIDEFSSLHEGIALQNRNQLCHEQVVRENVLEFLLSFTFREHIVELDNVDTMVFQLVGVRRSRHSRKEKVTLDDLFMFHSMDGGASRRLPPPPSSPSKTFPASVSGEPKNDPRLPIYSTHDATLHHTPPLPSFVPTTATTTSKTTPRSHLPTAITITSQTVAIVTTFTETTHPPITPPQPPPATWEAVKEAFGCLEAANEAFG